jgi:TolA-binding protein
MLWASPATLSAQDAGLSDSLVAKAGLDQIPRDLHKRWLSLRSQVDPVQNREFLQEGELVIKQLGELILAVGGTAPTPDQPSYPVFADLQNKLLSILDRIELNLALNLSDPELNRLLSRYRGEKDELSGISRSERKKLIEAGTKLLKRHESDPYFLKYPHRRAVLADLYFRITELLYAETYELFLEETDVYIATLDSLSKVDPQAARNLKQPRPDYNRVKAMYQRIVDEFPTSTYADDALYNLGVLTGMGETQSERAAANRFFETLVRIYPESDYKLNCLRRIGEYYFMPPVNNLEKAVEVYTRIASEYPESEYYSEALYKLGWCSYRLSDLPGAVENFARSLDSGYKRSDAGGAGVNIAKESINYIGVCFAVDPREWAGAGTKNLAAWITSNPERLNRYGREVVRQLGVIYRTQVGRYADAVEVYNKYLELFPVDPTAPEVMAEIVDIYQSGEVYNPQAAHTEKIRYFNSYSIDSEWWKVNTDKKLRDKVSPTLEKFLDMVIDETLVLATESKDKALYLEFEGYCRQYLRLWPDGPHNYKIHYNLAGILERMQDHDVEAIREYWQVVTHYSDTSQKEISNQRIVAIAQELMKREKNGEISLTAAGDIAPPEPPKAVVETPADSAQASKVVQTPLLNSERLLLSAFDLFLKNFPQSQLCNTMLYQAGEILYSHDWFPESRHYLEKLIAEYPDSRFIEDAYKLILEGYFKTNSYAEVEKVAIRIAQSEKISKDLKAAAKKRKSESVFLTASGLKDSSNHKAAADEFKRVALDNPDYQYADRSLFQAGLEYMQTKLYAEANEVFLILADRYPKSEFADKSLYNMAFNLQSQQKDLRAASLAYERLVKDYPKSDLAQGALSNASTNYNQLHDDESAIRVNQLYVQMYPTAEDASVYLFENASHFLALKQVDKANDIYRQFSQRYPDDPRTVQAFFERAIYALEQGDRAGATREFNSTLDAHQKLVAKGRPGSPKYASQSLSYLLDWEQEEYYKVRFTGAEAAVKAAKERKKQWRNSLVDKYTKLIQFGRKEGYHAFYSMGRLDEDFALATYQQDVPAAKDVQGRIDALAKVIDEAILLNVVAQQTYKSGFANLQSIITPIKTEHARQQAEYQRFSQMLTQLQKDSTAVGIPDSLAKLTLLQKGVAELDTAVMEAIAWSDSCRQSIPEVSILNGRYLTKLWYANFALRSTDRDEEVRMLFREEAIKNVIAAMAPEICGLYLQAWDEAKSLGLGSKWRREVEQGYHLTIDSLFAQYEEQTKLAQSRIDKLIKDFATLLPKGEDAKTPQGLYSDEIGGLILDQVDYLNNFTIDMVDGYRGVLDTAKSYGVPYGFGEEANEMMLQFLLDQSEKFDTYSEDSKARKIEYSAKYDETGGLQYDDAQVAFEDIGTNFHDYSIIILENGSSLRQEYQLSGMAGINLTAKLVSLNPEKYGPQAGLSSEKHVVKTSPDWLVWNAAEDGFQNDDFDDSNWEQATLGGFPEGSDFGILDSIGARSIWYYREKPEPVNQEPAAEMTPETTEAGMSMEGDTLAADTLAVDTLATETVEEEVPAEEEAPVEVEAMETPVVVSEADSLWSLWMATDDAGVRRYWFRHSFQIEQPPSAGKAYVTADDNFSLYLNGAFVAEDGQDAIDWPKVNEYPVLEALKVGRNTIAIEASDVDGTRGGVLAGLIYEFVPDMSLQINSLVERETERDQSLKSAASSKLASEEEAVIATLKGVGTAPVMETPAEMTSDEPAVSDESGIFTSKPVIPAGPTPAQLRDMRIIEKNKLR